MSKNTGTRRVVEWVSTDEAEKRGTRDIGGWGGFISKGNRWRDYIAAMKPEFVEHHTASGKRYLREACGVAAIGIKMHLMAFRSSTMGLLRHFRFVPKEICWR